MAVEELVIQRLELVTSYQFGKTERNVVFAGTNLSNLLPVTFILRDFAVRPTAY
jgi:hypothetical protein